MAKRLATLLVKDHVVDVGTMEQAFRRKDNDGGKLGSVLLELGAIDEATLLFYLSEVLGVTPPPPELLANITSDVAGLLSAEDALRFGVAPAARIGSQLRVLVKDPLPQNVVDRLSSQLGFEIVQHIVTDFRFEHVLAELYELAPSNRAKALIEKYPTEIGVDGVGGGYARLAGGYPRLTGSMPAVRDDAGDQIKPLGVGWSSEHLSRFLSNCETRDDVIHGILGYAANFLRRGFVLAIQKGQARGFASHGVEIPAERLKGLKLSAKAIVSRIKGLTEIAPPETLRVSDLYKGLHLPAPDEVLALLVKVGKRPLLVVLNDNVHEPVNRTALPGLERAANEAGAALLRIVRAKKEEAQRKKLEATRVQQDQFAEIDSGWLLPADALEPIPDDEELPEVPILEGYLISRGRLPLTTPAVPATPAVGHEAKDASTTAQEPEAASPDATIADAKTSAPVDAPTTETVQGFAVTVPPSADAQETKAAPQSEIRKPKRRRSPKKAEVEEPLYASPQALIAALQSEDAKEQEAARSELLLAEKDALDALREAFPGPTNIKFRDATAETSVPEVGPLLAAVDEIGVRFVTELWELMKAPDIEKRAWAALCGLTVRHPDIVTGITDLSFDPDPGVRRIACQVLDTYREGHLFEPAMSRLRADLSSDDVKRRIAAASTLAAMRDSNAVPDLIEMLRSSSASSVDAAEHALEHLTFQSFGTDKKKWLKWFARSGAAGRNSWLVDGVGHKSSRVRDLVNAALEAEGLALRVPPRTSRRDIKRIQSELYSHFKLG